MEISKHSLPQITPEILKKLTSEELLQLSIKMLNDLKELHDRLNQNSNNSSRPPSSMPPWEKDRLDKNNENTPTEKENKNGSQNDLPTEKNSSDLDNNIKALKESFLKNKNAEKLPARKPGKQKDSIGFGRKWNPEATETAVHCALETCVVCNVLLNPMNNIAYTQFNQLDIRLGNAEQPGLEVIVTPHILYDNTCISCGHQNRYDPKSNLMSDLKGLSEWRWIGPCLAALIVHLKMDFRLPIRKIQELLFYFGIQLSTGVIQECYEESGIAVASLENPIVETLIQESLVHADETIWLEKSKKLWLWIFNAMTVVYFCVGKRTKEQLQQVLNASFRLAHDGWLWRI